MIVSSAVPSLPDPPDSARYREDRAAGEAPAALIHRAPPEGAVARPGHDQPRREAPEDPDNPLSPGARRGAKVRSAALQERGLNDGATALQTADGGLLAVQAALLRLRAVATRTALGQEPPERARAVRAECLTQVESIARSLPALPVLAQQEPPPTSSEALGLRELSLDGPARAQAAVGSLDAALSRVNAYRAALRREQEDLARGAPSTLHLPAAPVQQVTERPRLSLLLQANQDPQVALSLLRT